MSESKFREDGTSIDGPPTNTNTADNRQYRNKQHSQKNGKTKKVSSNQHEILLGQRHNSTKPFTHTLGRGKERHAVLCHKKHLMWHHISMRPRYVKARKKHRKIKKTSKWYQKRVC